MNITHLLIVRHWLDPIFISGPGRRYMRQNWKLLPFCQKGWRNYTWPFYANLQPNFCPYIFDHIFKTRKQKNILPKRLAKVSGPVWNDVVDIHFIANFKPFASFTNVSEKMGFCIFLNVNCSILMKWPRLLERSKSGWVNNLLNSNTPVVAPRVYQNAWKSKFQGGGLPKFAILPIRLN